MEVVMGHTRIAIRRILCPVDFSEPSTRAMEHAVRMASFFDATVRVLHVVPTMFDAIEPVLIAPADAPEGPREKAVRELAAFVEPFHEWHVPIEQSVCLGSPAQGIEAAAADLPADLVVMGTHGRSGFSRFIFGSVTERVMHRVPCPVLAIGAHETAPPAAPPYRRILCPTKLVPGSEHALDFALALAARSDSRLEVLHVVESLPPGADGRDPFEGAPEFEGLRTRMVAEADAELRASIPPGLDNWCSVVRRVATGDAAPAILEAARTGRAEVIVMGVHGNGIERALFGSTIHRVLREATCSVLVLRRPRARKAARETMGTAAAMTR
jgi:nucleotide-binding universal stress UspA family protein